MLNNLKIRNKLAALLALPVIALLVFASIGYSQRSDTASQARADERVVTAAGAASTLVSAMEQEAVLTIDQMASTHPKTTSAVTKARSASDKAFAAFKDANGHLDLGGNSDAVSTASVALDTFEQETFKNFQTNRAQVSSNWSQGANSTRDQISEAWYGQLGDYRSSWIGPLISYVQNLAGLTTTPEVVLPLERLAAVLDYNLQTVSLGSMALATHADGQPLWTAQSTSGDQAGSDQPSGNQQRVYEQALNQDKTNAVLTTVAGGSSPIKTYFNQNVQLPSNLGIVFSSDWQIPSSMSSDAFSSPVDQLGFPSQSVSLKEITGYGRELAGAATNLTNTTTDAIETHRADSVRAAQLYLLFAGLVILLAVALAIWIARSVTQRLVKLTGAADRLSHEQLPRLVDSLKNPAEDDVGYLTSSFTEIDVVGTDEIGHLAGAFNRIQGVAVQVATEQAQLLRKGIGDMFVNLARRNQGLLDRQIEFIDQLESAEEDPDQLENLFRLDHLATRMRRNAESLLVLAGAEPSRRRGKPVPLADVVRAAVGEVEDFARIDMLQFDEVLVASNAALDIAHLLSELMENAANFSPPDSRVEVVGHRTKAEGYVISVTDHGIGMSGEALAESNDLLARPPLVGLALSRSLGFIVIGRLAARFGIAVRLMPSPSTGTTAMVSLPPSLITDQPRSASPSPAVGAPDGARRLGSPGSKPEAITTGTQRRGGNAKSTPPAAPSAVPGGGSQDGMPHRQPAGTAPDAAPSSRKVYPVRGQGTDSAAAAPAPPVTAGPAPGPQESAASTGATSGGLTKRVPRRAGGKRAVPGGDGERAATQNRRSPEEVRSMLSRYRSGMQKGRSDDESPTMPEDEGK